MNDVRMSAFLAGVEQRAYRMALVAVRHRDDALDIVQESMLQLVRRYSERPEAEWAPLFFRILQRCITDRHRRQRWARLFGAAPPDDEDWLASLVDASADPAEALQRQRALERLLQALSALPLRQQQVFLLRHWQGLDVRDTALAMGCGEGSVKTHLSRALAALREQLKEEWP